MWQQWKVEQWFETGAETDKTWHDCESRLKIDEAPTKVVGY